MLECAVCLGGLRGVDGVPPVDSSAQQSSGMDTANRSRRSMSGRQIPRLAAHSHLATMPSYRLLAAASSR